MKQIQRRVFVTGRVQGVGYRASTLKTAKRYPGLRGFVRNLADQRVEAVFMGDEKSVSEIITWCRKGPLLASVKNIEILEEPVSENLPEFCVQADA
jgi:acylphosphatase